MKHSHGSHAMHNMKPHEMSHGAHSHHGAHSMGKQVAIGSVASATANTGGKLMSKIAKHPVLVFGLGVVAGYFVYKYRKEIISSTNKAVDAGKDFVLNQKENLEDIVAESKEES
ncbi:hypothetical protein Q9L42_001295 [Methylomarinum sp. Ch1-1]|uniref:Uncharacterized protein n=1 Tax=Methylomarinum roseum TaxID=3067653 RepID=A0AAU7NW63_9GAMM|nr:hypothetical protein [Methylomarinum sp. Ch1-1]MDP4519107.1 hypothetical protein [Methylomarinum sp. Ch1-1]